MSAIVIEVCYPKRNHSLTSSLIMSCVTRWQWSSWTFLLTALTKLIDQWWSTWLRVIVVIFLSIFQALSHLITLLSFATWGIYMLLTCQCISTTKTFPVFKSRSMERISQSAGWWIVLKYRTAHCNSISKNGSFNIQVVHILMFVRYSIGYSDTKVTFIITLICYSNSKLIKLVFYEVEYLSWYISYSDYQMDKIIIYI